MKKPDGFDVVIDSTLSDRFVSKVCGYAIADTEIKDPQQAKEIPGVQWAVQVASLSNEQTAEKLSRDLSSSAGSLTREGMTVRAVCSLVYFLPDQRLMS